jgi:hypothetical protein
MNNCGESIRVMHPLFQEGEGGSIPTSPLSMRVETIPFRLARELNRRWHSRLPRFGTGFIENQPFLCFGAAHAGRLFAVAIWSNPAARNLPQDTWLELRRLAVSPDAPRHTCSWMLGVMVRLIRKLRPEIKQLVSYQDIDVHRGTIYAAAGWKPTTINKDGNWTRPGRPRPKAQSESPKQRWELVL